jgi:hypothetical protein
MSGEKCIEALKNIESMLPEINLQDLTNILDVDIHFRCVLNAEIKKKRIVEIFRQFYKEHVPSEHGEFSPEHCDSKKYEYGHNLVMMFIELVSVQGKYSNYFENRMHIAYIENGKNKTKEMKVDLQ